MTDTAPKQHGFSLTALGIDYPRVIGILMLGIVVGGLVAYLQSPRREDPVVRGNAFFVEVYYPGADSAKVEDFAVKPLEKRLNELDGVPHIWAFIRREVAYVFCEMEEGFDWVDIIAEARKKLEEAQPELPSGCLPPILHEFYTGDIPIAVYGIGGPFDYEQLRDYSKLFEDALKIVPGVAKVEVEGLPDRRVEVKIPSDTLTRYRVDVLQVLQMLGQRNVNIPGGRLQLGRTGFLVSTSNELSVLDDIRNTVVGLVNDSMPVTVNDLGTVGYGYDERRYGVRTNGERAFCLYVRPRKDADIFAMTTAVQKTMADVRSRLPENLRIDTITLQRDTTERIVNTFESSLFQGSLLVAGIIMFHLGLRAGIIVLAAIPLSLMSALIVIAALHITYHKVSVFSLVLVLGMLVDNAIVMVESMLRRLKLRDGAMDDMLLESCGQVATPLVSSTLTTVAAFVPLFMMGGMVGDYIKDLPWVACVTLLCSLVTALVFTPVMGRWILSGLAAQLQAQRARMSPDERRRAAEAEDDGTFDASEHRIFAAPYAPFMRPCLYLKWPSMVVSGVVFLACVAIIPQLGLELFPNTDRDHFVVEIATPDTFGLDATDAVVQRVDGLVRANPHVSSVLTYTGMSVPRFHYNIVRKFQENMGHMIVRVGEHQQIEDTIDYIREATADIPDCRVSFMRIVEGPYTGLPVALNVKADDRRVASAVADRLISQLQSIEGAVDVERDEYRPVPQFVVDIDEVKAKLLGLSGLLISKTIRAVVKGEVATRFKPGQEKEYDVVVRLDADQPDDVERLKRLEFTSVTGKRIPLEHVATIRLEPQLAFRYRRDRKPAFRVRCDVQGTLPDTVNAKMRDMPTDFVPPDCAIEYGGETQDRDKSFKNLLNALIWAVILIYLILVAQFDSFFQPLVVLFSLPLAVIGAVVGLYITGYPFGFMAFLGIVALAGIVVNDAILLIDYINVLRARGRDATEAIVEAGVVRHQPIYLTTITTVAGVLPLALNGGSLWEPLGWVIVFGIATATFLTLVIIPLGYAIVERV